MLNFEANVVGL